MNLSVLNGNGAGNNNRIDGYCYDLAGNLLDAGTCPSGNHEFTYDAENRIATAMYGNIVNTYGADGLRSGTGIAGQTTNFIYDYDGSVVAHQIAGAWGPRRCGSMDSISGSSTSRASVPSRLC